MAFKTVGIIGSPRKGMNTDTMVTKALEGAQEVGSEVEKIYLNDLKMIPCQACERFPAPEYCFFHDGMDKIYDVLENADYLIIGAPAYFGTICAQLKIVIDRSNCLAEMKTLPDNKLYFKSRLKKRKKALFIWVANISTNPKHALVPVSIWCKYFANIELMDTLVVTKSDHKEGAKNCQDYLEKAFQMGKDLVK